jgi:hypothetical protein
MTRRSDVASAPISGDFIGRLFDVSDPRSAFYITGVTNLIQIVAAFVEVSDQIRSLLLFISLLVGTSIILWVAYRWPKSRPALWIFAGGMLSAVAIYFTASLARGDAVQAKAPDAAPGYYVRITAFPFDTTDGSLDLDSPLAQIPVVIRDQYKHVATYKTRRHGALAVLPSPGIILIGACGLYHQQALTEDSDSEATALQVRIGIEESRLGQCKE